MSVIILICVCIQCCCVKCLYSSSNKSWTFVSTVRYPPLSRPNDLRRMIVKTDHIRRAVCSESLSSKWLIIKNEQQLINLKKITGKIEATEFPVILISDKKNTQWHPVTLSQALQTLRRERKEAVQ